MKIRYKIWFEGERGYIFGEGAYEILKEVERTGSLNEAARALGMSYRHAWGKVKEIEENLGEKLVISSRGGKGGGRSSLTPAGKALIEKFERYRELFDDVIKHPYRKPSLTVDGVLIEEEKILLIRRKREPFKDMYALPGGFVNYGERVEEAIVREMKEETGLNVEPVKIVGVYSDPRRDPRGHTVTVAFLLRRKGGSLKGGDDASEARMFPLNSLPPLAFDHREIIGDALKLLS